MKIRLQAVHGRPLQGGVLVEFALISFALYLLLAAIIGLGRWMALTQSAQDAARVAAREIALYPLPPDFTFADALADPGFRQAVYDPDFLVVDLDATPPGLQLEAFFQSMPVVNRALRPLMITSDVEVGATTRRLQHLPGVILASATSPTGLTVAVPRIDARDPVTGAETAITLVPVLEEVGPGSFSVLSPDRGLVAIRINVPYQSATLTAYLPGAELTPQGDPFNEAILAADPAGGGFAIVGPGPDGTGPYSGTYGLGAQQALGELVRPFRRLISAQAIFRREVYL
ncbi:MAG: TadE family protein [Planctomycetota bacterium]